MADSGAEDHIARHESDSEGRHPKRKKVTWADTGVARALAAVPEAGAEAALTRVEPAVVVLPCDALYDALTADLLEEQVAVPPPSEGEPLTQRQLLKRRLHHTEQLAELYEAELWGLLEELRLRHQQFTAVPGASVWKGAAEGGDDSLAEAGAADAGPAAGSTRVQGSASGAAETGQPGGAAGAAAAAAGAATSSSLKALWQRHQRGAATADSRPAAQLLAAGPGDGARALPGKQKQASQLNGTAVKDAAAVRQQQAQPPRLPAVPHFEDVEALVLGGAAAAGCSPVDQAALLAQRQDFVRRLNLLGRLEQSALGATCRQLDTLGGLAVLCGRRRRYVVRRAAVAIGRCTQSQGKVDVDLSLEAPEGCSAQRMSRQQAQLYLEPDGAFRLRCTGRRAMLVNGRQLSRGQTTVLPSLSHIQAGDASLLFIANSAAAARAVHRSSQPTV